MYIFMKLLVNEKIKMIIACCYFN